MANYTKALFLTILFFLILTVFKPVASQNCGCAPDFCCSRAGYCGQTDDYCGDGCQSGPCKGSSSGGDPAVSLEETVTPDFFDSIKNQAGDNCAGKGFYTRDAFINAAKGYPSFGASISKREIAAFFAHVTQETGFMCNLEEINGPAKAGEYCNPSYTEFPCAPGKGYYGRGPIQLSWNYNYGPCGRALNEDLLASPEKVLQAADFAFKTAFWYWTTNVRSSFRSGFGSTIKAINSRECGGGSQEAANRIKYFQDYCTKLGVQPGDNLNC